MHKWSQVERAELIAELDAAYFHLYGIGRADVEYILSTFQGLGDFNNGLFESAAPAALVLRAYDNMIEASKQKPK